MVTQWGMSERIGPVTFSHSEEQPFLGREMAHEPRACSEHTAQIIDEEITKILQASADRAEQILTEHRDKLDSLAAALLEHEVIDNNEIEQLIGPSIHHQKDSGGTTSVDAASTRSK